MEPVKTPPKKKIRRNSLKGLAGQSAFKLVTTCRGRGSHLETNADVADILVRLTKTEGRLAVLSPEDMTQEFELLLDFGGEIWDCVGIIIVIDYNNGFAGHAKPFIKIRDDWFDGDDEWGYLRKMAAVPSITMPLKILNKVVKGTTISKATLFYKERRFITERRGLWAGRPTFGQLGSSCAPDAMLSILMYADGFYETFNQGLYQALRPSISERFVYNSVKAASYTEEELDREFVKLRPLLPIVAATINIKNDARVVFTYDIQTVENALAFLLYSFIRFYSIETMVVRNYEVPNNASGGKRKTRRRRL